MSNTTANHIAIIGGTGLYKMDGFTLEEEITIHTPFGHPSDAIMSGKLAGRQVYFLPRHGRGHTILPHEINHRANIWALKSLGVSYIICVTAVGSLQQQYAPRDIVLFDQYFDRTSRRNEHTFFGDGIAAHIPFADPISENLRTILSTAAKETTKDTPYNVHDRGTYVNMDGPAFSTRAESNANRQLGFDVIGMTNVAEAKLAREAEISLSTLAMITDYDCWKVEEEPVSLQTVIGHLTENSNNAQKIIKQAIPHIPTDATWPEHSTLALSIVTQPDNWPKDTVEKIRPILQKYIP
ncbi:MAG: S-methyl-5'-thioadenosine phosphorylase [Akkermansiaceae bacterium]